MSFREGRSRPNPWMVLAVMCLGLFVTLLDTTIVNIAVPSIMTDLGASLDEVLWVLNAYTLVFAALLITSGRLGDIFGPRNMFLAGMAVFAGASALCGFARSPEALIAARAVQGLGGALMAPQALPIVTALFPPEKRGAAFALPGILGGLAVAVGPALGGLIVSSFGWSWVFYVNVPVGIVALALAVLVVPDLRPGRRHRLDLLGVLLATAGLFGVTFGLIEGERYDWGAVYSFVTIPGIIGVGAMLMVLFLWVQRGKQGGENEPLLPFSLFEDRAYALMNVVAAAMGFAMLGLFLPLTIYLQSVLGLSAVAAGLTILSQPVAMMLLAGPAGNLADRHGGKWVLSCGLVLFACGMGYVDWVAQTDSGRWAFLPGLIVSGVGLGCTWGPLYSVAMRDIRPQVAGVASGVLNTVQEMGGVLAAAVVGAVLQNRLAVAMREEAASRAEALPPRLRERFVDGFGRATEDGLLGGTGQAGGDLRVPPGLPEQASEQLRLLAGQVFQHGFVDAMHPSLILPIAAVALAAVCCLAVRGRPQGAEPSDPALEPAAVQEAGR